MIAQPRRLVLPAVGLLILLGAAAWLLAAGCCVDREITRPPEKRDLTQEEIRAKLTSAEFKDKLAGERQIDKLGPDDRLRILIGLCQDSEAAVRLIAVKHLSKLDDAGARQKLAQMAQSDPDPTVRELAGAR